MRTRAQWCECFAGTDACVTPVLDMEEAPRHPHNLARATFVTEDATVQPAPAPRFSRTAPSIQRPPAKPGEHSVQILHDWGITEELIDRLRADRAI
jgi:alpha-methylacyl-CoA racemase